MSLGRWKNDRENLLHLIKEWNESRLDIFALSQPNEKLEFYGVMRFFFQDAGAKVATKCVRVKSDQTAEDVTKVLVDKFHPDMKMLTMPKYFLYEVHQNGDARKLEHHERPLMVQLKWHEDDREGRFLLKSESNKNTMPTNLFASSDLAPIANPNFKRKLSKREKKEMKKKKQEELKHGKKTPEPSKEGGPANEGEAIAQQLYDEIPESGFTRSISNPEAVLRRRRQQKLEKKLKEFEGKDGSPDTGGPLRIYAETLKPEIPYKTLLVSMHEPTTHVVKDALEKYGLEKEDPDEYCLVMVNTPAEGQSRDSTMGKDIVIPDDDCPFAVVSAWPDERGELTLHLRRRTGTSSYRKKKKVQGGSTSSQPPPSPLPPQDRDKLPYLIQLTPDGREMEYKPKIYYIQPNVTEVGSENSSGSTTHYFPLHAPHILPQHSVIANNDGVVTVTPCSSSAETSVNGARIYQTTQLRHGMIVRFGRVHTFRYVDPVKQREIEEERRRVEETHSHSSESGSTGNASVEGVKQYGRSQRQTPRSATTSFLTDKSPGNQQRYDPRAEAERKRHSETTFGVDGNIETMQDRREPQREQRYSSSGTYERREQGRYPPGGEQQQQQRRSAPPMVVAEPVDDVEEEDVGMELPARLEYREAGEDAFFAAVISEVNGAAVHFKLAPTYTLYMCGRYRISPVYRPEFTREQRSERLGVTTRKMANMVRSTVRENNESASGLSFWMANASELLYFMKQDRDLSPHTSDAQQILGQSVHHSFKLLVHCIQQELSKFMPSFLDESDDSEHDESELDSVLSGEGARRRTGKPVVGDILYTLSTAMSLLYRCRVNAALTIQIFSQLFHFINMWLFNKIVLHPELELCTQTWGTRLKRRLSIIEAWAAKQGMELAADCHLCRINQATHLLQAPKGCAEDITSISSTCFKLNSLQLRCLLENYIPSEDEPGIPPELIDNVVAIAENTADELTRSDGQDVQLEEDPDLQLPFLLPEDGYSSDLIRGIPPGLREFLNPLCATGLCRLTVQPMSPGLWTVHFKDFRFTENGGTDKARKVSEGGTVYGLKEPEIAYITLNKGGGGMGLSIVAAKGAGQDHLGIYVKAVVKGGCADKDGRLAAGDQLLTVNKESLVGVSQERAAELMKKTGSVVELEVAKQGAIYHGLATLLNQSGPTKDPSQRLRPMDQGQPPPSPTVPEGNVPQQQLRWINEQETKKTRHPEQDPRDGRRSVDGEDDADRWAQMERRREQERRREMDRKRAEDEHRQAEEERLRREEEEQRFMREKREEEQRRMEHEKQMRLREEEERRMQHEQQMRQREEEERRIEHEQQMRQREDEQRRMEYERRIEYERRMEAEKRMEEEQRRRSREMENERNTPRIVVAEHQEVHSMNQPSYVIRAQGGHAPSPQRGSSVTADDDQVQESSEEDNEKQTPVVEGRIVTQTIRTVRTERPPSPHSPSSPSYKMQDGGSLPRQSLSQEPKRDRPPSRSKSYGRVFSITRESLAQQQQQRSPSRSSVSEQNVQVQRQQNVEAEHRQQAEQTERERREREDAEWAEKERIQREERERYERARRQQEEEERLERERRQQEEEERLERERRQREEEQRREYERRQREEEEQRERERRIEEEERMEQERRRREEDERLEQERRQREEEERIERERRRREEEEKLEREKRQREEEEKLERERRQREEEERLERERKQREAEERERRQREEDELLARERMQREEDERRWREEQRIEYERREWERRQREEERLAAELKAHEEKKRLERERQEQERQRREQEERERKEKEERERLEREAEEQRLEEERRRQFEIQERERREKEEMERREREENERRERAAREQKEKEDRERQEEEDRIREREEMERKMEERVRKENELEEEEKRKRKERLELLYQEQREKEEDDRKAFELKRQKELDRKEREVHEREAEEKERQEEERIMKQLEEDEQREKEVKRREQEREQQRREEEQRWMREVEMQRAYLREPVQGVMHGSSSLDRIDQMDPEDVEREFNRRLEEERQRSMRRSKGSESDMEEKLAREQWRLERLHLEREHHRQVQQKLQDKRQREQEEWLAQQKMKRDQQRVEQEQQKLVYKMKEEEEKERKRWELQHKKELENRLRRESSRQKDLEELRIREERRQNEMKLEHEKLSKLEEQRMFQEKDEEMRRQSNRGSYSRTTYDLHPVHQNIMQQALGYQETRRHPSDDNFHYGSQRRDPRASNDQQLRQARSTPHLLSESEFNRPMRKHVSFSDVTTEIPHSPTSPMYTQAPTQRGRPFEDDDPPPPPPPPPPAEEGEEEDFPAPPLPPPPKKLPPPPPPKSHLTYEKYEQQMQRQPRQTRERYSSEIQEAYPTTTVVTRRQFVSESEYRDTQRRQRPVSYPARPSSESSGYGMQVTYSNEELNRHDPPTYASANLRPVPTSPIKRDFEPEPGQGGLSRLLTDQHKVKEPPPIAPKPEKMTFRDKLKVFNPNEYTPPPQKTRASKWQQQQLSQLNGQ